MSEDAPIIPIDQLDQTHAGDTLVMQKPDIGLGADYETNIPDGIDVFAPADSEISSKKPYEQVNPGKLDELPGGIYEIKGTDPTKEENFIIGTTNKVSKSMEIVLYNDGKYLSSVNQIGNLRPEAGPESNTLLEKVGFVFTDERTLIPTPLTAQKKLKEAGIDAELFPDTGIIPPTEYVEAFRNGKYPIATGEEGYYSHDIQDDHVTGVILGGEVLKNTLSKALESKISEDGTPIVPIEEIGVLAENIDRFTQTLRAVTTESSVVLGEAYGIEKGRQTLFKYGMAIGMDEEQIGQILEASQQKARELELPVKQLK